MLDPRFKSLRLNIIKMSPCTSLCVKIWNCGKLLNDEDSCLDIFEMIVGTNEPTKELMDREL
jgi:hypothetical protein